MDYTPLDEKLNHPLLDVYRAGAKARDDGTPSPWPGHSLEHCVHVSGWVARDLRLALDAAQGKAAEPSPERKPTPVEALAERLAKVEDRLARLVQPADNYGSILARIDKQNEARHNLEADLNRRIDKVAEIIGERVSGLVDEIAAVRDSAKRAHEQLDEPRGAVDDVLNEWYARESDRLHDWLADRYPNEAVGGFDETVVEWAMRKIDELEQLPAFPTGGASTAEAAADAVLPVPQRGDRVRLEGALSVHSQTPIPDGWYEVIGATAVSGDLVIQVRVPGREPEWLPWAYVGDSENIKEVKRNAST